MRRSFSAKKIYSPEKTVPIKVRLMSTSFFRETGRERRFFFKNNYYTCIVHTQGRKIVPLEGVNEIALCLTAKIKGKHVRFAENTVKHPSFKKYVCY